MFNFHFNQKYENMLLGREKKIIALLQIASQKRI